MVNRKSFTIIELLIVITIMSFLVWVVYLNYSKIKDDVNATKVSSNLRSLKIAIESYATKTGKYPENLDELKSFENSIISEIPIDDFNPAGSLGYSLSPNKNYFAVWSAGRNKIKGALTAWVGKMPIPDDDDDIGATNGTPPNENWR